MNKTEMYTSLNKGIPNYIPIDLDIETLLRECVDDKNALAHSLRYIGNAHQRRIANIAKMTKAERAFFKKLQVWTNRHTSETNIFVSSNSFLEQLKIILGIHTAITNIEEINKLLESKVARLFDIKTPQELQKEFPLIYQDYLLSIKAEQQIISLTPSKPKKVIIEQWQFYNMLFMVVH